MNRARWLWLAASFIILGVCGYLLPRDWMNARAHHAFDRHLRDARQADRDLNEAVLRLDLGLLSHYDVLVERNAALRVAHTELQQTPSFISEAGRAALAADLREVAEARAEKTRLVEDFKTEFAVLKNSLAYFPTLIREAVARAAQKPEAAGVPALLDRVLQDTLVYHLSGGAEEEARLRADLLNADAQGRLSADAETRADLQLVGAHATVILTRKPAVDAALRSLAALPTQQIYDRMQTRYEREYTAALTRAQTQRLLVYLISLLALITVFTLIIRQFRRSERALRVAEEKYRSIFEAARDGIFQTTLDGRYISANPALAKIYGYASPGELVRHVTDIGAQMYTDPNRRAAFTRLMQEKGEVSGFESEIRRADGTSAWVSESAHAIRDAQGRILYHEGTVDDITLRKRIASDRERQSQRELFHQRVLLGLAQLDKTDFNHAIREILDTTSYALGVSRVSAWRLLALGTPEEAITLIDLFDFSKKKHVTDELILRAKDYPRYFTSLKNEPSIVAHDARADPRTSEFTVGYLTPLEITSLLDVTVWSAGKLAGVVCLERTGPQRRWEEDEVDFANSLGSLIAVCFETAERLRAEHEASRERERAEQLLLNILPGSIARRLQAGEGLIADHFAQATVLFADIADFTGLSAGIPPQAVVSLLNRIFSAFDQLAEKHGLEKIKTIGDAYMVVGGLPIASDNHAHAVVEMALDMLAACQAVVRAGDPAIVMRIGIHTGPVVAGVIGIRKFIYDLWGDTVNVASRMESHGVIGEIQVTAEVVEKVRDRYDFTDRGEIEIKGRGRQHAFLLRGRRGSPAQSEAIASPAEARLTEPR